jgi:hypothetical protein
MEGLTPTRSVSNLGPQTDGQAHDAVLRTVGAVIATIHYSRWATDDSSAMAARRQLADGPGFALCCTKNGRARDALGRVQYFRLRERLACPPHSADLSSEVSL